MKATQFFVAQAVRKTISGRSISKIIILILRVGTSRNKNIDNRGKKSCTYEIDQISLLHDATMSSTLNFYFYLFIATQKKKIILEEKINSKETNIYM